MKKKMTIEEMIAAGMPWEQIKSRINELQREQKEKEEKKVAAQAKAMQVDAAKERLAVAFVDYMAAEGLPVDDRAEMVEHIKGTVDELSAQIRQAIIMDKIMNFLTK